MIKKNPLLFVILIFLLPVHLFSQQMLTNINSTWSTVLPGKVLYEPELSDFGFAVMTDAKNLMAFTNEGKLIWEKNLTRFYSPFFGFLPGDFSAVITNNGQRLTLLNPDGNELWVKNFDFSLLDKPFPGRDGRFFIRSSKNLLCLTVTGLQKWIIETPEQSKLPLQELPDGSIIVFLEKLQDYKTKALRITPFGEVLEEITFAGQVVTSLTTPKGVLLTFTDGSCGLFNIQNNQAQHKWLLQKDKSTKNNKDFFVLSQNKQEIIYINHHTTNIEIDYIDSEDGSIYKSFIVQNLNSNPVCFYNESGVFLSDFEKAYFYNNSGKLLWSGSLPEKKSRDYYNKMTFTNDNHLILFGTNWSINAYRTSQSAKKKNTIKPKDKSNYNDFYKFDASLFDDLYKLHLDNDLLSEERYQELLSGNYGKKEILWCSQLLGNVTMYLNFLSTSNTGSRVEKSVFENDSVGLEKMLSQMSLYQTDLFTDQIVSCLKKEKNKSLLHAVITGIANNGYDPNEQLLIALANLAKDLSPKDEVLLCDICEAVYVICKTMGAQTFNDYGITIFSELMYPKYTSKTRDCAKEKLRLLVNKK